MSEAHRINFRFNPDDPMQKRAWEYLENLDKKRFKSRREAITLAVVDYFGRLERQQTDPDWESREREDRAVSRIVEAVERELARTLPGYLAGCVSSWSVLSTGLSAAPQERNTSAVPEEPQVSEADIDWDFLGE
ncbi:MAG: adenylate cyclase [Oscillibacter sp.]|nr:adenylate cyclase [Oscillibacter sp.]